MTPNPNMLERAKTAVKESALSLIGKKREADFKQKVAETAANEGLSQEEAERATLEDSLTDCILESSLTMGERVDPTEKVARKMGVIDLGADNYQNFETGLRTLIPKDALKKYRKNADANADFRPMKPRVPTGEELLGASEFFEAKHDGQAPCPEMLERYSRLQLQMQDIMGRIKTDIGDLSLDVHDPATSAYVSGNLEKAMQDFPEIGADIGKMLACKERILAIEKQFARRMAMEKSAEKMKLAAAEFASMKNLKKLGSFLKSPIDIIASGGKLIGSGVGLGYAAFKLPLAVMTLSPVAIVKSGINLVKKTGNVIKSSWDFLGSIAKSVVELVKLMPPAVQGMSVIGYHIPKTLLQGGDYYMRRLTNKSLKRI